MVFAQGLRNDSIKIKNPIGNQTETQVESQIEQVVVNGNSKKGSENQLINLQKKSIEVVERIGAVQLSKQGVGDAATAVTKATGTQKQEGSGQIFVRGLGDRYNGTTLNGLQIPSNDPEFKNIDLEIFKTSMVEYISLDKVYNPRFSGDFGGANINIVSKEHSGKPYFKVDIGSSINLQTFDKQDFKLQDGGPGFFGFKETTFIKENPGNIYPFTTNWNFKNAENPFNSAMSVEGGTSFGKFSLFGYAGFENAYQYSNGREGFYTAQGDANKDYNVKSSEYQTNTTALINFIYKINANHKINFTSDFIHSSNQTAKIFKGYNNEWQKDIIINRGDNKITNLWINQLFGVHKFAKNWSADWAIGFNMLESKRPDRLQNTIDGETFQFISGSGAISNHRYFDELKDNTILGHLYFTKNLEKFKINFGYDVSSKNRNFENTTIGIVFNTVVSLDPENVDAFINPFNNALFTYQTFQPSDRLFTPFFYDIKQNIQSGLANADIRFSEKFIVQIGGRFDDINMKMNWNDPLTDGKKDKHYTKFLPALNAKYSPNDKQNFRFSASKTYTLPQAKELIPIAYFDVTTNVYGNKNLYPSGNYNLDLKWELFPKSGEIFSVAVFGKYIENAIARTTFSISAASDMTYLNASNWGYIYGAELEFRKDIFTWNSSKIYTFLNGTFMQSKQELKSAAEIAAENDGIIAQFGQGTDDVVKDDIQGVPDFLANINLGYSHKWNSVNTLDFVISYSHIGKNLFAVGTNNLGNFYELGRTIFDINLNITLDKIGIGITAKNLLNPHNKIEQTNKSGTFTNKDYTKGSLAGLSFSYRF
jgi:outer membrane receptor protein involved in Fe transport